MEHIEDVIPEEVRAFHEALSKQFKERSTWDEYVLEEVEEIPDEVRAFHEALSKNYVEVVEEDVIPEEVRAFHEALSKNYVEEEVDVVPEEEVEEPDVIPEEEVEEPDVIPEEKDDLVAQTTDLISSGNLDHQYIVPGEPDTSLKEFQNEEVGELAERIEKVQKSLVHLRQMTPGSGEVRLEYLDDIDRDSVKSDGMYLKYQESTKKWIGSVSTSTGWDPSGYEYTGDKTLYLIENEEGAVNGLEIEENTWTVMPCVRGSYDDNLPSSFSNRIWNDSINRFSFAEIPTDGVVLFRVQTWLYPETNNALITCRIRFVAVNDGLENVLNEDGDRIVLEDDSGNITGDYFEAYSFFQTVSAQEMNNGAGVEHERTFIFPVYVGNAKAQRGWGQFELNSSCDFTLYDTSVVAVLN